MKKTILDEINDTYVAFDKTKTVLDLFCECVEQYSDNIAIVYENRRITYAQLDEITTKLACRIVEEGGKMGGRVAVLIPRCEYMPIVPLALFKAGMSYVPLDYTYPSERLSYIIADADVQMVIGTANELTLAEYSCSSLLLPEAEHCCDIMTWSDELKSSLEKVKATELFTILYTSGTTGKPKGALLSHMQPIVLSDFMRRKFDLTSRDVVGTYCSYGFDVCNMDMFLPLTCGAALCIVPQELKLDLLALNIYLNQNDVALIFLPTAIGSQYIRRYESGSLRNILIGGEKLLPWKDVYTDCNVYNVCGPTECFDFNFTYLIKGDEDNLPIGRPNDNNQCYIVSEDMERVAQGEVGEICLAGLQVGMGYLNLPELTAKSFTNNPFADGDYSTLYHTGDLGYVDGDGNVVVIGRKDTQVKIQGNRIELKEVEAVVREYPGICEATVDVKTLDNGRKILVAYVTSEDTISADDLCRFIGERKPSYMIPTAIIQMDAIPLNQNGKVDRRRLPMPEMTANQSYVAPRNILEEELCEVFAAVLGLPEVGIDDDIVELGGDSLSVLTILDLCKHIQGLTAQILIGQGTPRKIGEMLSQLTDIVDIDTSVKADYPVFGLQDEYFELLESVPGNMFLHVERNLEIDSSIDALRLKLAIEKAINNHPGLKATFGRNEKGEARMYRHDDATPVVAVCNASEDSMEQVKNDFMVPFDMANGPLYHIQIVETEKSKYLLMDFLHFVIDGPSLDLFIEDVSLAYSDKELMPETWTAFDVATFESALMASTQYDEGRQWFEDTFAHLDCDKLPVGDVGRDTEPTETGLLFIPLEITKAELEEACSRLKTTPAMLTGAAYAKLMAEYTEQDEVLFVTVSNGRDIPQKIRTMGVFSKGEPVYCKSSLPVAELTEQMNKLRLNCIAHNAFPYSHLSISSRLGSRHFFQYQANSSLTEFCNKPVRSFTIKGDEAYYGLTNEIMCDDSGINLYYNMVYKSNIYTEAFARQYIADYIRILKGML